MDFDKPNGRGILEMNSKLNIFIVEKLFGGQTLFKDLTDEREITHIEQKVMKRVMDKCFSELTKAWLSENDILLKYGSFESNPEYAQIVSSSEPVVVVTLEVVIHGSKTLMNLCYPYNWLSKVNFRVGDIIFVEEINGENSIKQIPEVNGAIVVLNPHNGDILALSGGISFELSELSHNS